MYFVYEETLGNISVIGGAVNSKAARVLAEKRAKEKLIWKLNGTGFKSNLLRGKTEVVYTVERGDND
jgi:hypothetical protein